MSSSKYIHGYHEAEQERLREQALVIENPIYEGLDLANVTELLEIGSGVGAQTEILLRRFPHLSITGIEREPLQLAKAKENMAKLGYGEDSVRFIEQDATDLKLDKQYDGAFICWVLEHINHPVRVLSSLRPFLKENGMLVVTEVFNSTFYTYPSIPCIMHYWSIYNQYQEALGGDPEVGAKLGNLLHDSGYRDIQLRSGGFHLDKSNPQEKETVLVYWKNLMNSAAPGLLETGLINQQDIQAMEKGIDELRSLPNSVFYYRFIQAIAFS